VAIDPGHAGVRIPVGHVLMVLGEYAPAAAEFEAVRRRGEPGALVPLSLLAAYALGGRRDRALALAAEFERRAPEDPIAASRLVHAYAALGDAARALDALDGLIARRQDRQARILVRQIANEPLPYRAPLRRDPRFARLRDRALGRD